MNARQKVKKLKQEVEFYKNRPIKSHFIYQTSLTHRHLISIIPKTEHPIPYDELKRLAAPEIARKIIPAIIDNIEIEEKSDLFKDKGYFYFDFWTKQ